MTYLRVTWDEDVIGLHLNEKDLKSSKERLSYSLFSKGRLGDQYWLVFMFRKALWPLLSLK